MPIGIYDRKHRKEKVGYTMIHRFIRKKLGRPLQCEKCKKRNNNEGRSRIEYANKSKEYTRELTDWIPLCRSCHMKYDEINRSEIQKKVWQNPEYRKHMSEVHKKQKYAKRNTGS